MTTDRAKRYAANRAIQDDKRHGCLFCRSKRNLVVDHLSGTEDDSDPRGLVWLCKSCNTRKGAAFAKAGIGRRTAQYNPDLGLSPQERKNFQQLGFDFPPRGEYDAARAADRKRRQTSHAAELRERREARQAEARRKKADRLAEQASLKDAISRLGALLQRARKSGDKDLARELAGEINDLASDLRRNPAGIRSARQWQEAVNAVVGAPSWMSVSSAASRIRATGPGARRKFAASARPNPGKIPTYGQYKYAVSLYQHGKGDPSFKAVIDRVPKSRQSEYARAIWGERFEHGTEHLTGKYRTSVPF